MNIQTIKVGVDNCYLLHHEGRILIDGGMPGKCSKFFKYLKKKSVHPKEINAIVITHCHWDHIGCLQQIRDMTGANVIVHQYEEDILRKGELSMPPGVTKWGKILGASLHHWSKKFVLEPIEADIILEEEDFPLDEFGIEGTIVFTPGHSQGSISVVLDSGDAFVGDMAMNGPPLTLGPSLPIFAEDMPALKNSWRKLINRRVKTIYPAHGKPFPIEKLLKKVVPS